MITICQKCGEAFIITDGSPLHECHYIPMNRIEAIYKKEDFSKLLKDLNTVNTKISTGGNVNIGLSILYSERKRLINEINRM